MSENEFDFDAVFDNMREYSKSIPEIGSNTGNTLEDLQRLRGEQEMLFPGKAREDAIAARRAEESERAKIERNQGSELLKGISSAAFSTAGAIANSWGATETADLLKGVASDPSLQQMDDPNWLQDFLYLGGSGLGSTAVILPAAISGNPYVAFAGTMAMFYGDTVDRNLEKGMSAVGARTEALLESGAMAAVESFLGTVPALGKLFKGKSTAGIAAKVIGKLEKSLGKAGARSFTFNLARNLAANGVEEGVEEAIQYLIGITGETIAESTGQGKDFWKSLSDNFSANDLLRNTYGGVAGGIFAGGLPGLIEARKQTREASKETVPPASVPDYIRTDTAPAEESSSVNIRTNPSPSVQTPSDTAAPTAAQSVPQYIPAANTAVPAVNTTAEEVKARVDSMSDDAVMATASRMGIPGVATEPVDVLRGKVEERMIAEAMTAAPSETAPARTPVSGENSIARETLAPGQTPLAPPPANIPSPSAAAPVDIQSVAPTAAQSAPQVPEYTRTPQVTLPAEYTGNPADGSFEPQNVSAYTGEVSNGDFDTEQISNYPETPMPVFHYQPSEVLQRDQRAIEAYQEKLPGQMISPASNSELSKDEKDVLTAVQRISRALGVSKAMPIKSVVTDPKKAAIFEGAHLPGGENKETGVRRNLLNMSTSQSPADLFHAAMHELTHSLIEKDKAAYNKLLNEILPLIIDKKELKARLQNYAIQRGFQWGKLTDKQKAVIEEEFICDTVADLMQSERFWDVLSQKDMTLAQKFLKALKDLLAKFKGGEKYLSRTEKVFGDDLQKVIALAQQFVVEASGKKDLNALFRGKAQAQTATQDTTQVASAENLQVAPAEESSSVNIRTNPSPSVQTPSDTAAPVEQVGETQIQEELNDIIRPTAEHRGITANTLSETAAEIDYVDGSIGENFDAHGIAKGKLSEQLQALLNLLDNGIDPNKTPLYTAPFTLSEENRAAGAGLGTATNGAYKDGLAVVLSDAGKTINDDGIKIVFINDAVAEIIPSLQQRYPNIEFHKLSENKQVLENKVNHDQTQTSNRTTAMQTGEQIVSKPEPKRRYFNGTFKAFWDNLKQLPHGTFSKFSFGRVSKKVRDFLKEKGINTTDDYNHTIDNSGISHMEKQHGNKQKEEDRGQLPITEQDFEKIPDIVENYDRIGVDKKDGKTSVIYAKKYPDGTTIFFEEIRTGRRELAAQTIWKMKRGIPNDLLHIFSDPKDLNAQSDSAIPPTNTIPQSAEKSSGGSEKIIDKITSAKAGSRERIMAFTDLPDGEYTVNGKTFTKEGNAFTLDGKVLNAKEIEKATRTTSEKMRKTAEEAMADAEVDYTPEAEPQPEQKKTLSDKMRGKGKKSAAAEVSEVSEKSDQSEKTEKIEDFGEKIGGAKKDRYTDTIREKIVDNYTDEEIFGLSVDKLFPKLDYEKLADDGMDKSSIAVLKAARETLPHKPSDKWKYKKNGYVSAVRQALEVAQAVLDGKMDLETLQKRVNDAYSELADLDRQLEERKNKFPDGAKVTQAEYNQNEQEIFDIYRKKSDVYDRNNLDMKLIDAARAIELINIPMSDYRFDYEILSNATYRNGRQDYNYRSYRINRSIYSLTSRLNDEHSIKDVAKVIEDDLKKRADAKGGKVKGEAVALPRQITVIGHTVSKDNERKIVYAIASEPGRKGFILKDGFETAREAADFVKSEEGKKELEKRWAEIKDIKHYNPQESPRQGIDYRNGRNITPQELAETFGFRGVEFGNWADQKNRQKRLNETYDAFMDMAAILGISPKAVGLGGRLGMAFGSRGSGWANAHFESNAFVINITKTRGAGSLAHEWLHALDNYFARQSDSQHGMATDMHELNLKNMRNELKEKWMGLRRTLEMSAMKRRSGKHSDYWSRIWEVAARAFSRYIQDKAIANNMSNDYLVSLFPEELLADIQKETTPYALAEDMVAITPAFDAFFATLQEKIDDSGNTILFSKTGDLQQDIEEVNQKFNDDLDRQIAGTLPKGYIHQLGTPGDILLSTGVPDLPIELSARQLKEKADTAHHPFDINDVRDLPKMLQKPIGVFSYGDKNKAQNIIVEVQKDGKNFIVGLSLNFQHDGLVVNSIRGLYPKDLHEWLTWIQDGKSLYLNKEKIQKLIDQQRRNLADVEYLNLDSINNIIQNFENPSVSSKNPEKSSGGEIKRSMPTDLTPQEETDLQNNENFASEIGNGLKFSKVTDLETIDKLNAEENAGDYLTLYRSVQIGPDGKLHSPMAAKVAGKWGPKIELGVWEQSDERPELAKAKIAKDGKIKYLFDLNKGNGKTIGGVLYNPYIHSSNTMLNDQFSEAYQRPELVTIEVHVPKSELTSGYKAKRANDAVGMKDWKAGVVQGKLTGKRKVMLSRWDKPVRIVPDSEVAQHIKELIAGKDIAIPANVVTPALRAELEKIGVKIDYSVKEYVAEREQTERPEIKFSQTADMDAKSRKYYDIPWKKGMQKAVTDKSVREPVFVSATPEIFQKIGFTSLPMMMNVRHLRLNYYNKTDFENMFGTMRQGEHAHNLRDKLKDLPVALEHPLAVVVNKTPNATPGSVVAITDMNVNGKKVVVPVLIESVKTVDSNDIDSHLVLTVYDSNNWMEQFLAPAIKAEKSGVGIFYFDKTKANRYTAYSKKIGNIPTGFVHNIAEAGINVKPQTETLQFKRYFGDWQAHPEKSSKVVNDDGKPLVVYHGTRSSEPFFVFEEGDVGFHFGTEEQAKERAANEKSIIKAYLNIRNPLVIPQDIGDWNGQNMADYILSGDIDFDITEDLRKTQKDIETLEKIAADSDSDGYDSSASKAMREFLKSKGYDGIKYLNSFEADKDSISWIAFDPTQIKSATDNIGTFDGTNPDIRFSKSSDIDPNATQTKVEQKHEREVTELTEPKLTAGEQTAWHNKVTDGVKLIWESSKHLFGWKLLGIKKAQSDLFTDSNRRDKIGVIEQLWKSPLWLAKKNPDSPVASIVGYAITDMSADKTKIANHIIGKLAEVLKNLEKDKKLYKAVNKYLVEADRNQTGAGKLIVNKDNTEFTAVTADGKKIGKFNNMDAAWEALFINEYNELLNSGKFNKQGAEAVLEVRRSNYRTWVYQSSHTIRMLREAGVIDPDSTKAIVSKEDFSPEHRKNLPDEIDLIEELKKMGMRCGYYMPRIRMGDWQVVATKKGKPTQRLAYLTAIGRGGAILDLIRQGYDVRLERVGGNRDVLNKTNPMVLSDIFNQVFTRAGEALKNQMTIKEETYTKKDGSKENQLIVDSQVPFSGRMQLVLKDLGGRFYDGAWRFANPSSDTRAELEEVLKRELAQDMNANAILKRVFIDSLVDLIEENGASSSKIARRDAVGDDVVIGYEEDLKTMMYLNSGRVAGSIAHSVFAKKSLLAWNGMDFDRDTFIQERIPAGLEKGSEEYKKALLRATSEYYKAVSKRALSSSLEPNDVKYMEKYVDDILRNPSSYEMALGVLKSIAAVRYLGSLSSSVGNILGALIQSPAMISSDTGINPLEALGGIIHGAYNYGAYRWYSKHGKGKINSLNQRFFDILHKNGWDESNMLKEVYGAGRSKFGKVWNKASDFALWIFSAVEEFNRASTIWAAAHAIAKQRGVDIEKLSNFQLYSLIKEAKGISDEANGVYDKTNKLPFQRGGNIAASVDALTLFQTYSINQLNVVAHMLRNPKTSWKGFTYMTLATVLAGGMVSDFAISMLVSLLGSMVKPEDEEMDGDDYFYNQMLGGKWGEFFKYGIPGLLSVNMSGTLQSPAAGLWEDGLYGVDDQLKLTDFPTFSIFGDMYKAIEYANSGQTSKAWETVLPKSFGGIPLNAALRAFREANDGVTDRYGRRRKDINDEYIVPSTKDTWLRLFGFNPVSISEKTDRVWNEKKIKAKYSNERSDLLTRYRNLVNDPNTTEKQIVDLALEIEAYNAKATRSKRNIPFIDETMLKNALKDKDNKFFVENLDKKSQQRRDKKAKGKIVIRNGKLVRE